MTAPPGARGLAFVMLLAWPLQPLDDVARAWVQGGRSPALEAPMRAVSDRSRVVLIAGAAVALVLGPAGRRFVGEAVVALLPVNAVVEGLKWTVNRPRPDGDTNRRNSSFPSSHAANAFTVAAVLARRWRRSAVPAWAAAALVAFSRLYLDRHWLSDVWFGALLAVGTAWLAARVMANGWPRRGATRTA